MSLARMEAEVRGIVIYSILARELNETAGFTRKAMGATFEGQTKDTDGQVWAEAEVEGVSSEVSTRSCQTVIIGLTCG